MTYSIALFFRKQNAPNVINERLWQGIVDAISEEEALGKAIFITDEKFKEYDLVYHVQTQLTPTQP